VHAVSIGGSAATAAPGRDTVVDLVAPDRVRVGVALRVVDGVAAAVVVDVDVVDVAVDDGDVDELAVAAVTSEEPAPWIAPGAFDARAANAGKLFISTGSARIGATARAVTMRRLIEPRFGRAR
jgi:hypothetical protein